MPKGCYLVIALTLQVPARNICFPESLGALSERYCQDVPNAKKQFLILPLLIVTIFTVRGTDVDSHPFSHMRNRFTGLTCFFPHRNTGWGQKSKKIRKTGVPVELLLLSGKHTGDTPFPISNYCPLQVSIVYHCQTLS